MSMGQEHTRHQSATLRALKLAQDKLDRAETAANARAVARDDRLLAASEAGASRRSLEEATGLSPARITQVLRRARVRRGNN
jgi:hypothetical protein